MTSASFLCFRAAFHRGSFGLSSSSGSVGAAAVFTTGTSFFVTVVLTSVVAGSTFIAGGSTFLAVVSTFIAAAGSTVMFVVAGFTFVALVLCSSAASFVATASCVVVSPLFVPSCIVFSSSSGITRPKLHYIKFMEYHIIITIYNDFNSPPLSFSLAEAPF